MITGRPSGAFKIIGEPSLELNVLVGVCTE